MTVPAYSGYAAIFFWILLGEAGVPVLAPAELVLIAGGVAAGQGLASVWLVLVVALVADLLGTMALYGVVRASKVRRRLPRRIARGFAWAARRAHGLGGHSAIRVAAGRAVPLLRVPAAAAAALAGLPPQRYALAAFAGGLVWVCTFVGGTYLVSRGFAT